MKALRWHGTRDLRLTELLESHERVEGVERLVDFREPALREHTGYHRPIVAEEILGDGIDQSHREVDVHGNTRSLEARDDAWCPRR